MTSAKIVKEVCIAFKCDGDNQWAIEMANNSVSSKRTRHMHAKRPFIRSAVLKRRSTLSTSEQKITTRRDADQASETQAT